MPILQVYYPEDALSADRKAALAGQLTEVLLNMEGGARTQGGLAFATVFFTAIPAGDWWVGGRTDAGYVSKPGKFLVRVSVPEGYMSQTHKSEVHAMVNAAFLRVLGEAMRMILGRVAAFSSSLRRSRRATGVVAAGRSVSPRLRTRWASRKAALDSDGCKPTLPPKCASLPQPGIRPTPEVSCRNTATKENHRPDARVRRARRFNPLEQPAVVTRGPAGWPEIS